MLQGLALSAFPPTRVLRGYSVQADRVSEDHRATEGDAGFCHHRRAKVWDDFAV